MKIYITLFLFTLNCLVLENSVSADNDSNTSKDTKGQANSHKNEINDKKQKKIQYKLNNEAEYPFSRSNKQNEMCIKLVKMLNEIGAPMQCDINFLPKYSNFKEIEWKLVEPKTKWDSQLKERSWFKARKRKNYEEFESWYNNIISKWEKDSDFGREVVESLIDIDNDGNVEKVVKYKINCEKVNVERGNDGITNSMSSGEGIAFVLTEDEKYDLNYADYSGWNPFRYNDEIFLIKWTGGNEPHIVISQGHPILFEGNSMDPRINNTNLGFPNCEIITSN